MALRLCEVHAWYTYISVVVVSSKTTVITSVVQFGRILRDSHEIKTSLFPSLTAFLCEFDDELGSGSILRLLLIPASEVL